MKTNITTYGSGKIIPRDTAGSWEEVMRNWVPRYDYERWMIPHIAEIRAANLLPGKIAGIAMMFGDRKWKHDTAQNIMTLPEPVRAARRDGERRRQEREERARFFGRPALKGLLHRRISERAPGSFLARQEKIDYALLATAHARPGWSMTDTLRQMDHPAAQRLAKAS